MLSDKLNELNLPKLYETDGKDPLYLVRITFGNSEWFLSEYDHDEKMAFGFANVNNPDMAELGYVSIEELENVKATQDIVDAKTNAVMIQLPVVAAIDSSYIPIKLDQIKANLYR